jgi:hypothetical protein
MGERSWAYFQFNEALHACCKVFPPAQLMIFTKEV